MKRYKAIRVEKFFPTEFEKIKRKRRSKNWAKTTMAAQRRPLFESTEGEVGNLR